MTDNDDTTPAITGTGIEGAFFVFDEFHSYPDFDPEVLRSIRDLTRAGRDDRIFPGYDWPIQGQAVNLADLERALSIRDPR